MKCENCGKEHDGSYGTGRFCSDHCRRVWIGKVSYDTRVQNGTFVSNLNAEDRKRAEYGRWKCTICGEIFNTRRDMQLHRKDAHNVRYGWSWNKGLTAETSDKVRQIAEKNKTSMLGKAHACSKKTKERLSEIRSRQIDIGGGFKDVGWYRVKNISGKEFTVRGTWELTIANLLNERNILWIRNQMLKYERDGIMRTYNPDFYLPCSDEYIEVKGYYSDNDKMKMQLVMEHNPGIRIYMIGEHDYPLFKKKTVWLNENLIMKPQRTI